MKKTLYTSILIILILVITFFYKYYYDLKPDLELITKQQEGINDFYIKNDKVYIVDGVTIKNNTTVKLSFSLSATSEIDYEAGLLKDEKLEGFDEKLSSNIFSIDGNDTKTLKVVFVGNYGGFPQKYNRLMPTILVVKY